MRIYLYTVSVMYYHFILVVLLGLIPIIQSGLYHCDGCQRHYCLTAGTITRPSQFVYMINDYVGWNYRLRDDLVLSRVKRISFTSFTLLVDQRASSSGGEWALCYLPTVCGEPIPKVNITNYHHHCLYYAHHETSNNLSLTVHQTVSNVSVLQYVGVILLVSDRVIDREWYPEVVWSDVSVALSYGYSLFDVNDNGIKGVKLDLYRTKPCWYNLVTSNNRNRHQYTKTLESFDFGTSRRIKPTGSILNCEYGPVP